MDAVADRFVNDNVGAIFLYTNEAHPGENYPHLTSMKQKFRHADALKNVLGVTRPILVDSLDGVCHRAYGSMPNMSWILSRSGIALYKSEWSDARSIERTVEYLLEVKKRRTSGERLVPFRVERADFRIQDREAFFKGLERNGPKAVRDFEEAFP